MLEFVPRHLVPAERVAEWILHAHRRWNLEGVTFLGGEPMLQAKGLALVAERSRRAGLSVMVFTGFTLEYLGSCSLPGVKQLLAATDLLVDGPYLAHCPETKRHWVGSTNQRFHFLTDRYQPGLEYDPRFARGIELRIRSDGMATYNGWPGELISEVGHES
ncbi:Ribonucleotide reductase of class III (anaerobic), activating protein [Thermogutta terrifontis]|uniref:Ribonucleotide reductase of class III (Anaerobic), activating protein n=2 Tax=Thermogutta terrifontis TaxID=1331910 RepID=A0A286RG44_9BACT|nr:Ribonucleotide reductase of class III (anaerobic), activating protein [Thermogutta terrifontis]